MFDRRVKHIKIALQQFNIWRATNCLRTFQLYTRLVANMDKHFCCLSLLLFKDWFNILCFGYCSNNFGIKASSNSPTYFLKQKEEIKFNTIKDLVKSWICKKLQTYCSVRTEAADLQNKLENHQLQIFLNISSNIYNSCLKSK